MEKKANMKILVCCHQPAKVPNNDVYMPIHAGKAVSGMDLGIQGDNTGDHISEKNPFYCELTAMYWAWKNLRNADYVGLCHYRRYFKLDGGYYSHILKRTIEQDPSLNTDQIPSLLSKYDIILPNTTYTKRSVYELYNLTTIPEQMQIFIRVLLKMHPEYEGDLYRYLNGNQFIKYNMLIANREIFDLYCEFLFPILDEVHSKLKPLPYLFYNRVLGIFAEVLLPIYCFHKKYHIKQMPLIHVDESAKPLSEKNAMMKYFFEMIVGKMVHLTFSYRYPLINNFWDAYLKKDNINI